ncbi:MarR family transcriptional regulator [Pseudodesulfovibrio thermohalotolerans]|uniref:MarR family winged helix-turn-helix transcriptional regulator n=1 Tax=Pseudodesulfovibrio thermohalotolerans TaxID=2880651 RepID=UPI0024420870|nr:MarR family transcriptional regulator [Pseudodesulfovibrio thermohalotolerans]WFS62715.1 MarR family transcriptional regulator [Pseudodesulfovibrio thermohalotolerans]
MTSPAKPVNNAELAGLFRLASRLMARVCHGLDQAHHAQQRVLSLLLENGPMPQGELLEILDVRSSSLSELLRKLEDRGLILRERNEDDRRSFIISPTDEARALARDDGGADGQFDCLDDEEREQLRTILGKLVASLREDPMSGGPGRGFGPGGRGGRGGRGNGFGRGRGFGNGPGGRRGRG